MLKGRKLRNDGLHFAYYIRERSKANAATRRNRRLASKVAGIFAKASYISVRTKIKAEAETIDAGHQAAPSTRG